MQHVDLLTFLKEHVGIKHVIDILLMDNEGAEVDTLFTLLDVLRCS